MRNGSTERGAVVNRNLLLVRYSFERIAKSFKRGELQRRWGGKVTIGKTQSKSEVRGKRVRGMAGVVQAGQGACVVGCCEGDSKPAHARPAYAALKFSAHLSATLTSPNGYLLGSHRIATAPEPNSSRLTSLKSTRFDSPANNVGPWPASLVCTTNSYSSFHPSSANASGSFTPPINSPLPDSRFSR